MPKKLAVNFYVFLLFVCADLNAVTNHQCCASKRDPAKRLTRGNHHTGRRFESPGP